MIKKLSIIFISIYLIGVVALLWITYTTVKQENEAFLVDQYGEHFYIVKEFFNNYFDEIENDLHTLASNETVRIRDDQNFTSFLNADEATFQYNYSLEELAIIDVLNDTLTNHPHINSVYMGRENGSFVRATPRTKATQYDPRQRPWYLSAIQAPGTIQMTSAYSSVTNSDINIAFATTLDDVGGNPYGVVGIDVTLNELSQEMKLQHLSFNGYMELVDENGVIIISPIDSHLNQLADSDASCKKIGTFDNMTVARNNDYYKMTDIADFQGGHFVAYAPVDAVEQRLMKTLISQLLISLAVLLFIGAWSFFLIRTYVNRPIRDMMKAIKKSQENESWEKIKLSEKGEFFLFQEHYNGLIDNLESDQIELNKIRNLSITSMASLTSMRDYETGVHLFRTSKYVELMAVAYNTMFPDQGISAKQIEVMVECSPLHDIGKVAINDAILLKPGKLTDSEYEEMKKHTLYGRRALEKSFQDISNQLFVDTAINMIYHHHERWDGEGYPQGLKGNEIPIEARLMALADAYDVITSKRIYKQAESHEFAKQIVIEMSGSQFDPDLVQVFLSIEENIKAIADTYQ